MAVQPGSTEKRYAANGVTTMFPVPFLVIEAGDLQVLLNGALITSGYTHYGIGSDSGYIQFAAAPSGDLLLQLNVPFQRLVDYQENGDFLSSTVNRDFDRIWQALKQLLRITSRSPVLGVNDIDGQGQYQAKGNRLSNLADPVLPQDAATKSWSSNFFTALLESVSGLINTTTGILYDAGNLFDYLRFGVSRSVDTIAALRLLQSSRNQRSKVMGYYAKGDGGGGDYYVDQADTTSADNGGSIIVASDGARWKLKVEGRVRSQQFGIVSGVAASQHIQLQRCITYGCTYTGGVELQFGQIRTDQSITFPNLAFDIIGASGTGTEFVTDVANLKIFDFSSCNGPAKTMRRVGFSKITPGTYGGIIGIYTNNTNGLYLESCWSRGLLQGIRYHGSFINLQSCVFEYNYYGVWCDSKCQETVWSGTTYYRNEQADFRLTGNNATFASVGSNHIGSRIEGIRLDDCTNAQISAVSFEDDGTGFTPNLLHITGVSSGNIFTGFSSSLFGKYGIYLEGANVKKNMITGINLRGIQATGNRGIRCVSSSDNYLQGTVEGFEAGVEFNTCSDEFSGRVAGCGIGQFLTAANYCVLDVINSGNTNDVSATSTTIIHLKNFSGVRTGLDGIPYILTTRGYNDEVLTNAIPTALTWKQGDTAVNRLPTASNPSRWRCVVGGTPGTWKPGEVLGA